MPTATGSPEKTGAAMTETATAPVAAGSDPKKESAIVQRLMEDAGLDPKVKEYIKGIVANMGIPAAASSPTKLVTAASSPTVEAPGSNLKKYTEADMKRLVEEVANSVKKRYEEEKKILISKLDQQKKDNEKLMTENKQQKETYRILEGIGGTVSHFVVRWRDTKNHNNNNEIG